MIQVFEIILCTYLKTISPDVGGAYICVLFITDQYKKKYWAGYSILVGKCCHCRINTSLCRGSKAILNLKTKLVSYNNDAM